MPAELAPQTATCVARGNRKAYAIPCRNGYQRLPRIDFDRLRGRFRRAAIFRGVRRNSAAAIPSPTKYFAAGEQRQRMVPTATDRRDDIGMRGRCVHGKPVAMRSMPCAPPRMITCGTLG